MAEIASRGQLRLSFLRWALVTVPAVLLLGFLSGRSVATGAQNPWYAVLAKPAGTPPDWAFPVAWGLLYVLTGLALAVVLNARGASARPAAIGLFVVQLVLNLAFMPIFFGAHLVTTAIVLLVFLLLAATATTVAFARVRTGAAWLMVPYLAWTGYALALTIAIGQLNPDASRLAPGATRTQITL